MKHYTSRTRIPFARFVTSRLDAIARRWRWVAVLSGLVTGLVAALLAPGQSVWFDEAYSILLAHQPMAKLLALTSVDTHPPLYYIYLKLWATVWGYDDMALRASSIVLAVAGVVAMIVLVRRLFSPRVAVAISPFVVVAPFYLRYAYELRMYALASLLCIVGTIVFDAALRSRASRSAAVAWLWYAVIVALGLYTLYITAFVWAAHAVWVIAGLMRRKVPLKRWFAHPWVYAMLVTLVLYVPWAPSLLSQLLHPSLGAVAEPVSPKTLASLTTFAYMYRASWQLTPLESLVWLAMLAAVVYTAIVAWRAGTSLQRRSMALLGLVLLVHFAAVSVASLPPRTSILNERYFATVSLVAYALVAVTIIVMARAAPRRALAIAVLIGGLSLYGVSNLAAAGNFTYQRMQTPSTDRAAAAITCTPRTIVLASQPLLYFELLHYLPSSCDLRVYNNGRSFGRYGGFAYLQDSPDVVVSASDAPAPVVMYVYDQPNPPLALGDGYKLTRFQQWHELKLARYER